ncbi:hypothetical protein BB558_001144 [Smittium angustum]|uniref:Uncharacterized protein n=1 Tax=Smittium angustum TaxID=133377 RepID=A0A2U1JC81_SMIAN|nr:hypothetical protein BB558_001144 [Smittium angustum]
MKNIATVFVIIIPAVFVNAFVNTHTSHYINKNVIGYEFSSSQTSCFETQSVAPYKDFKTNSENAYFQPENSAIKTTKKIVYPTKAYTSCKSAETPINYHQGPKFPLAKTLLEAGTLTRRRTKYKTISALVTKTVTIKSTSTTTFTDLTVTTEPPKPTTSSNACIKTISSKMLFLIFVLIALLFTA